MSAFLAHLVPAPRFGPDASVVIGFADYVDMGVLLVAGVALLVSRRLQSFAGRPGPHPVCRS